jgi:hypothetical protein
MTRRSAAVLLVLAASLWTQPSARAVDSKTRSHVEALASDGFDGRLTGSPGERLAGDYIVAELKRIGARPLPGRDDYRLPFEFTAGTRDGGSSISIASGTSVAGGVESGSVRHFGLRADASALVLRQRRGDRADRVCRVRARRSRQPGFRIRQLRRTRREGQGRSRPALLSGGRGSEDARHSRPLLRPALQGDGRTPARRQGHARRHGTAFAERG